MQKGCNEHWRYSNSKHYEKHARGLLNQLPSHQYSVYPKVEVPHVPLVMAITDHQRQYDKYQTLERSINKQTFHCQLYRVLMFIWRLD